MRIGDCPARMMSVAPISSRSSNSPSMRRLMCKGPWRTLPPGNEMLLRTSACRMSSMSMA
jgi:hypothetical protein